MFYRGLVILVLVFWFPVPVQAGWWDFLFPSPPRHEGQHPAETLRAPFADDDAVVENLDSDGQVQSMLPLEMRHRTNSVITLWVQQNVPALLSYKSEGYNGEYGQKVKSFSKAGGDAYTRFLHDKNFLTTLKSGRYDVSGFLQDYPIVLNEGAVDGRYRWLYQVKVMVSFLPSGLSDYSKDGDVDSVSREYAITMQIGRVSEAPNEHSVLIETWDVKDVK